MAVMKEPKTMDEMLVEGTWNIYYVSSLYNFKHDRDALAKDATDLVTFLREADSRELRPNQGVTASVRAKNDLTMFMIHEQVSDVSGNPPQRLGAFVYYSPNHGAATSNPNVTNLLLLQGNEALVAHMCAWIQHRYQCIVALHSVNIQSTSMEQFAQALFLHISTQPPHDDSDTTIHAPLKITLRNESDSKIIRSVTVAIPYRDIQAKHELQRERRNTLVDQDRMIRSLFVPYCTQLSMDMSSFRLSVVSAPDCVLDHRGALSLLRAERAIDILNDVLDIFVVQDVRLPETSDMTF
ncbi:hypothetical protein LEN26_013987 [Aphanomyces euteiches]|nr:hypothetical protein LEN26_013987 [Aphanomyces euteiches]KAH9127262.1 hypothetical protein AeMF1_002417 [Aphanomyces euteiches]KAH9187609.1 hypothetical protein AeNC1_010418 [Aphanomyces euteiches]